MLWNKPNNAIVWLLNRVHPDIAHKITIGALCGLTELHQRGLIKQTHPASHDPRLHIPTLGWRNPIGLAAGFDKNAKIISGIDALGFGALEVGSVTLKAHRGNPGRHIWHTPDGFFNRCGLKNKGSKVAASRIARLKHRAPESFGLSVSLASTPNSTEPERELTTLIDRFSSHTGRLTLNFSCPNRHDQDLDQEAIGRVARHAVDATRRHPNACVMIKLSPNLDDDNLRAHLDIAQKSHLHGVVLTNTFSGKHKRYSGGFSGQSLAPRSLEVLKLARSHRQNTDLAIVSCGGIMSADDVWQRLCLGANAVQIYTAFIKQGPALVNRWCRELRHKAERAGVKNVSDVVGNTELL